MKLIFYINSQHLLRQAGTVYFYSSKKQWLSQPNQMKIHYSCHQLTYLHFQTDLCMDGADTKGQPGCCHHYVLRRDI